MPVFVTLDQHIIRPIFCTAAPVIHTPSRGSDLRQALSFGAHGQRPHRLCPASVIKLGASATIQFIACQAAFMRGLLNCALHHEVTHRERKKKSATQ